MIDTLIEMLPVDSTLISVSSVLIILTGVRITSTLKRCMKINKIGRRMDSIVYKMEDRI